MAVQQASWRIDERRTGEAVMVPRVIRPADGRLTVV
jgi:hypothetical protein